MVMIDQLTDDERNQICEAARQKAYVIAEYRPDAAKTLMSAREKLMETFPVPSYSVAPDKLGLVADLFDRAMKAGDRSGALDVVDKRFFGTWDAVLNDTPLRPGELMKLKADIRGLLLAIHEQATAPLEKPS